jgi:osmotically-inducible protein OsmY
MRDRNDMGSRDEDWGDRRWQGEGEQHPDRARTYEQSTQTGGYGQQGWQGGYSQPGPGQVGQQQDYQQQQRYGQGAYASRVGEHQTAGYGQAGQGQFEQRQEGGARRGEMSRAGVEGGYGMPRTYGGGGMDRPAREFGTGEGQFRGRGPKGYTRSDARIGEDVSDRLSDDSWVDASDIEVQVMSAIVTLEGTVPDRDQKRRAEDIAADVSGVQDVTNHLRVRRDNETVLDKIGSALAGNTDRAPTR